MRSFVRIRSQTFRNRFRQHGIRPRRPLVQQIKVLDIPKLAMNWVQQRVSFSSLNQLFHSLEMVLWLTFRVRATSFWDSPAWRRPIAIFLVAGSNLGMTAYQLSNNSQALLLYMYTVQKKETHKPLLFFIMQILRYTR
jgi:hypothetical protein